GRRAPRLQPDRRPVVAHVALHHQVHLGLHLRDAEGAGQNAVVARDAARLPGRVHDAVLGPLDGVGRTDLRAGRRVAVQTHHRHRLRRVRAIHVVELNHRLPLVSVAFRAGLDAGLAANTPAWVDEELEGIWNRHGLGPGYC